MIFRQLFDSRTSTYTYLLADPVTRDALLIDPVREQIERDLEVLEGLRLKLRYVADTHVHADHVTGASILRAKTGAESIVGLGGRVREADRAVVDGDVIKVGDLEIDVLATPGHTDSCVSYVARDAGMVFTGDTLLIGGCGRTDFQQGDARTLFSSIREKLFALPDETMLYPGHDYRGRTASTIGDEKRTNPRVSLSIDEETFVAIMDGLGLAPPQHIAEAVPANQHGGAVDDDGAIAQHMGVEEVDPAWVATHLDEVAIVDVRNPPEFHGELGHIPGARCMPLAELIRRASELDRARDVVVVCRAGRRSLAGAQELAQMGFSSVRSMAGGMVRWCDEGRPAEGRVQAA